MSAQTIELHTSAAETSDSQTTAFPVNTATMAELLVDLTAITGTNIKWWLEGRNDASNAEWWPIMPQALTQNVAGTKAGSQGADIDDVIIATATAAGNYAALYTHLAHDNVRLAWDLTGTTATFQATLKVK